MNPLDFTHLWDFRWWSPTMKLAFLVGFPITLPLWFITMVPALLLAIIGQFVHRPPPRP